MSSISTYLNCPVCGQAHSGVELHTGERAICVRCGEVLFQKHFGGKSAGLALTLAAAMLAVPASILPLVTLSRFGNQRISFLISGVNGLWAHDMPLLAIWVLFCGLVAPFLLLGLVVWASIKSRHHLPHARISRAAHRLQQWAMPEVFLLSVLVAFLKLGDLVEISVGPGLWCYALMSICSLFAWRSFSNECRLSIGGPESTAEEG